MRELEAEKEEIQKAVGEVVRKFRKQRKQSKEAFAGDCSIHSKYLGEIERGETLLSIHTLYKLAAGTGFESPANLINLVDPGVYKKYKKYYKE